ncbi:citrate synthase, partial [bacterium]|nr:citrate synthase [bacterium]
RTRALDIGAGRGADAVYTAYRMNGVAARAATALGRDDEAAWRIVNALLVLAADAPDDDAPARIASEAGAAGADLYGCVLGALSAFAAPAFAGSFDAVEALFADAANGARAREAIADRLRRGERIPGSSASENGGAADFLLARATGIDTPGARAANAVAEAIHDAGHGPPSLVFACGAATHTLGLGPGSAAGLFALARCAGWIARALDARSQTPGRH